MLLRFVYLVVQCVMPRMGKKTLYLDLDAVEALEAALDRLPGQPLLSPYLSQQLLPMSEVVNKMADLLIPGATRESVAMGVNAAFDDALQMVLDAKGVVKKAQNIPPDEAVLDVTASKPKRQKKSA